MLLKGKNAILTGGAGGIGSVIAEEFLIEGARVFLVDRDENKLSEIHKTLSEKYPTGVYYASADVSNRKALQDAYQRIKKELGTIDILVNAAGIHGAIGPLWEINLDEWERALRVNLLGTVNAMQALLPDMITQGHGKIINFAGGGATNSRPFFSSYAASKTAVVRITEIVAEELREKGHKIDVNAISPGAVNTKILDDVINAGPEKAGAKEYEAIQKIKQEGGEDPKKAATLVVFLASHLSDGLSGRLISAIWDNWQDIPKHLTEIMESDIYTLRRIKPKDRGYNWGQNN